MHWFVWLWQLIPPWVQVAVPMTGILAGVVVSARIFAREASNARSARQNARSAGVRWFARAKRAEAGSSTLAVSSKKSIVRTNGRETITES